MFGFFKLIGAPPNAFSYYRKTKNELEKKILEDLYKRYDQYIKEADAFTIKAKKIAGVNSFDDYEFRKFFILSTAFEDLHKYGTERNYPEHLINLFYKR